MIAEECEISSLSGCGFCCGRRFDLEANTNDSDFFCREANGFGLFFFRAETGFFCHEVNGFDLSPRHEEVRGRRKFFPCHRDDF